MNVTAIFTYGSVQITRNGFTSANGTITFSEEIHRAFPVSMEVFVPVGDRSREIELASMEVPVDWTYSLKTGRAWS